MEINFCLNEMLGVDSRILSVSRGSELADKARELELHFATKGKIFDFQHNRALGANESLPFCDHIEMYMPN